MQLITDEYRDLNKSLHANSAYGSGSSKWSDMVTLLRQETGSDGVLDYGCGKGTIGDALNHPEWLHEYDPAISGKDEPPKMADLVVCTDVLEHIEPDLLDNVIEYIARLSRRAVFIVISTQAAVKFLDDGRNAHLSLHDAAWWKEKLEKKFFLSSWSATHNEIVMVGSTVREVGELISKSAVSDTIRYEQSLLNCPLVKERVHEQPRHDGRAAIVCYGPSLHHTWHMLRADRRAFGAKICTVSGAHDFLIERGIVPDIHIECDPREHKAFFTRNPHQDVDYWMASCCHPVTIAQLRGNKLALWHAYNSQTDLKIIAPDGPDPDNFLLCGGGSVGCRAVNLMYMAGYRTFSIYGMDCSFDNDGIQHAGPHSGKIQTQWDIRIGKRWFKSSGTMVYTARGFVQNMRVLAQASKVNKEPFIEGTTDRIELFMHGDGMLQEMYRALTEGKVSQAA